MSQQRLIHENEYWVFFGYGADWEPNRCDLCWTAVHREQRPTRYAINCWKLELFFSNCTDLEAVKRYFLDEARRDPSLLGKWLKAPMRIPRERLTSVPASAHPRPEVREDGVILIYTTSIAERDARKGKILADLRARGLYTRDDISARRGCLNFDDLIGPWRGWYDLARDYPADAPFLCPARVASCQLPVVSNQ